MMLTFPMLNGIGLVGAGANAERLTKAMVPVITLNGAMCFLFALALTESETARAHPAALTALAAVLWLCVYAVLETRNVVVPAGAATGDVRGGVRGRVGGRHILAMAGVRGCAGRGRRCVQAAWPACWRAGSG